jgi:hypothetical protein
VVILGSSGYHLSSSSTESLDSKKCLYHQRLPKQVNSVGVYDLKALAACPSSIGLLDDKSLEEAFRYLGEKTLKIAKLMGVEVCSDLTDKQSDQSIKNINEILDTVINAYGKPLDTEIKKWANSNQVEEVILKKLEYLDQKIVSSFYTDKNTADKLIYIDDLFPANIKVERSIQCANKILKTLEAQNHYNLPLESVSEQQLSEKLIRSEGNYLIPGVINTKALIDESLNYNQGRVETIVNPRTKKSYEVKTGLYSNRLDDLLLSKFRIKDNQLLPRDSGFEESLRLYLNNMASYQPTMFNYCYAAAQHLTNIQKPIKNICTITAHQSETNLAPMMEILNQQDFNKKDLTTFIFINGDNKSEINKRMAELEKFQEKNPDLDIRVFGGIIPKGEWSFGFKALGLNAALISYQMSNLFTSKQEHDSDPAVLFFDADIKAMKPTAVKGKIQAIKSGTVIEIGEITESPSELKKIGMDYYLINRVDELSKRHLKLQNEELFQIVNRSTKKTVISMGGNSTSSGIATVLLGGFKPHFSVSEDINLGRTVNTALSRLFNKLIPKNYVSELFSSEIECDGDAVKRTVNLSRPIIDKYSSHDGMRGNLTPISRDGSISIKRLEEEINGVLALTQEKYDKLLLKVPPEFTIVIEEYLNEKKSNFYAAINLLLQEEVTPLMQSKNSSSAQVNMEINQKTGFVSLEYHK